MSTLTIPVVLFAYARPEHLQRTLASLRDNRVPLIYAFSDGPRTPDKVPLVEKVRATLRTIDWCEVVLIERTENLGLGRSIMAGVTEVLGKHESCLVFEDDLVIVPGAYDYLVSALHNYREDPRVMSVTGWTHPRITPPDVDDQPYFDGRAECWVWGTWGRAWQGINDKTAREMMLAAEAKGIDRNAYGSDLPGMAEQEFERNIWAVRFLYHHILNHGLCLRPPWSMTEHIGFDALATNANAAGGWNNPSLRPCPPLPQSWPDAVENPECPTFWRAAVPNQRTLTKPFNERFHDAIKARVRRLVTSLGWRRQIGQITLRRFVRLFTPPIVGHVDHTIRRSLHKLLATIDPKLSPVKLELTGDYSNWADALAGSTGYNAEAIFQKTRTALMKVKRGEAAYERDSVLFDNVQTAWPLLAALMWVTAQRSGRLNVLDFGGSLGSAYFQNKSFLDALVEVRWHIVEQSGYVLIGKREFQDERLRFYDTISDSVSAAQPDVIVLSGVLQYVEFPYEILDALRNSGAEFLVIDRTPFWDGFSDRLCVQHVPAEIYIASYPCRIFSWPRFVSILSLHWSVVREFEALDALPGPVPLFFRGLLAVRHSTPTSQKHQN